MWLSQLLIDVGQNPDRPRPGRLWLRNLYRVHQRLCMAFPSDSRKRNDPEFLAPYRLEDFPEQRHLADHPAEVVGRELLKDVHRPRGLSQGFLFRMDPQPGGGFVILVQSAAKPDWDYAFHNADYLLAAPPQVKSFDLRFAKGQHLRFRLVANPTKKIDTMKKDKRQSCTKEELQKMKGRHGKRVPVRAEELYEWLARRAERAGFSIVKDSTTVQPGYVYVNDTANDKGQRLRSVRYDGTLTVTDPARFQETLVRGIGPGKAFGFGLLSVAPVKPSLPAEAT